MTLARIEEHARLRPRAVAAVQEGRDITYVELARDVRRCAYALRALGVSRGERVAVGCVDGYRHWLVLLGLEVLGAANASLGVPESEQGNALLACCDRVLSEQAFDPAVIGKQHRLTRQWFDGVLASGKELTPADLAAFSGHEPVRISRTSATTGRQVLVLLDHRVREARVRQWIDLFGLDESARILLGMPMTATLSYHQANACAQRGGTVVFPEKADGMRLIQGGGITHLLMLPWELARVTDLLPARPAKPPVQRVYATGAAVPPRLRDKALERLAESFTDLYATNEVSFVSTGAAFEPGGFGRVWPGVEVQVVDDHDHPVPDGGLGRIRIRSECMGEGYLGDPQGSAEFFRQGWFYPGDLGEMRGQIGAGRELRLLGRNIDVLNAGGIKIAADRVEELARKALGAVEVAACVLPGANGVGEVWIAVHGTIGDDALKQAHARLQKKFVVRCHLVRAPDIPRDESGKVARATLQSSIQAMLARVRG
jgi:acyl-CoA synthetase (AMP-forming)/AMP-acid ligase II